MEKSKVMLVDREALVRSGIRCLVNEMSDFVVVEEASESTEAMRKLEKANADIICIDITTDPYEKLDLLRRLKRQSPAIAVIVLSTNASEQFVADTLEAGASAYLLKDATQAELGIALRSVLNGGSYLSPTVSSNMIKRLINPPEPAQQTLQSLTPRQRQILTMICNHMSNKQIAHALDLSAKTIAAHRTKIMARLGVRDMIGLVVFANKCGLIADSGGKQS